MKFNSKSMLLNRGLNYRLSVEMPQQLSSYNISKVVWEEAVNDFNTRLDERSSSTHIGDIKIDVLRLVNHMGTTVLWVCVRTKDVDALLKVKFVLKGEVIFAENSDIDVDKMTIHDIMFGQEEGIFTEKLESPK